MIDNYFLIIDVNSELISLNKPWKKSGTYLARPRFYHLVNVFQKSDANLMTNALPKKPALTEDVQIPAHSQVHALENKSVKSLTINQFALKVRLDQIFHLKKF